MMERVDDLGNLVDADIHHSLLDHVRRPEFQHLGPEVAKLERAVETVRRAEVDVFDGRVCCGGAADGFSDTRDEEAVEVTVALQPYTVDEEEAVRISRVCYYG